MHFRRSAALALAAAALVTGCKEVDQEASPSEVIVAAFASPLVPSPNDVVLASSPKLPAGAQRALLQAFVKGGGFPSDQAVSITVPFVRYRLDAAGSRYVPTAAVLDPATVTTHTVAVLKVDGGAVALADQPWELDPTNSTTVTIYDPATLTAVGTYWNLALRRPAAAGNRRWPSGRYVFAVRGGPSGVKTTDGKAVGPDSAVSFALAAGASGDLSNPQNVPIGTSDDKRALLELVRKTLFLPLDWATAIDPASGTGLWNPSASASVVPTYNAVNTRFPAAELATFAGFEIAPAPTATVPVDSGSGIAPLPLDLLRVGPADASGQKTIAFNPSFGSAAAGLTSLNGFSTTALVFAQVVGSYPVNAATVNGASVQLYRLPPGGAPEVVPEFKAALATGGPAAARLAGYVAEPTPITTTTCGAFVGSCSTLIALQPAAALGTNPLAPVPGGPYTLPPLDEEMDYAVVITTGVKDITGAALQRSSMSRILVDPGFDPIATSTADTGIALIPGMPAASANVTAVALAKMRAQLRPIMTARGRTDDVVLAWTFRTQSVKATSQRLVALPYASGAGVVDADPEAVVTFSAATIAAQHGVPGAIVPAAAFTEFAEVKVETVNLALGAAGRLANSGFMDPANPTTEVVTALVAVPALPLVTGACPANLAAAYTAAGVTHCAPLVVYEHGIRQSKTHMIPIAAALAQRGFIVAAIDQAMQGDRAYCSGSGVDLAAAQANANLQCCGAATCPNPCAFKDNLNTSADFVDPSTATTPIHIGVCEAGGVRTRPLTLRYDGAGPSAKGIAVNSGNRLLTLNFFRLRDAFRQDVIDQSALVKALAPMGPGMDAFATHLAGYGIAVDPTKIYFVGHSGGAINSTMTLAVNPRVTRAATYAGGANFVDIASNPESSFNGLLLGLLPPSTTSSDLLKLLQIAKWILDPSEAANYAPYVTGGVKTTLPSPLPFAAPATRSVLTQFSVCDSTVPNTQNLLYAGLLGQTLPANPGTAGTGPFQWFSQTGAGACPADRVSHGNIIDYAVPSLTQQAQSNIASFLADPTGVFATPVTP